MIALLPGNNPRLYAATLPSLPNPTSLYPEIPKVAPLTPVQPATVVPEATPAPEAAQTTEGLLGSIGYARPGGNCVNEPGVNNPHSGNPISWPVLSSVPTLGATALFTFNHTGVVTGIWSNGDIEVRHQNYSGGQHRFPRSAFRGFR